MTLLTAEGISKSFRGIRALHDVSLQVDEGSILGIIGPNGAGKTTLFSALSGSVRPDAGRVSFAGRDVTSWPEHRRARGGLVRTFQLMRPFGSMTVVENVAIAAASRTRTMREADQRAREVVEQVDLARYADHKPAGLPTGALKRLELARALATRPRLLLLDEVLAGLVPAEREPVLDMLAGLRGQGMTLLMVEHVMAAVMRLSDQVLVLDQGKVLAYGPPEQISKDPRVVEAYLGEELTDASG